jgi:hypothetical protein
MKVMLFADAYHTWQGEQIHCVSQSPRLKPRPIVLLFFCRAAILTERNALAKMDYEALLTRTTE